MASKFNRFSTPAKVADRKEYLSVIILADEPSKGMKQIGPKSLLLYNKDYIINHQLKAIYEAIPSAEIVIGVGFESHKIISLKNNNFRIVENINFENTTCIETVRLCLNNITRDRVLIISGDCILNTKDLLDVIQSVCIVTSKKANSNNIGIIKQDGLVTNFAYGLDEKWIQILNIGPEELREFKKYVNNQKNNKNPFHHAVEHLMSRNFLINVVNNGIYKIERGYNENIDSE